MLKIKHFPIIIAVALLSGCQSGPNLYTGEYSYKKSGEISSELSGVEEIGTMRISKLTGDSVIMMYNPVNADVYYVKAIAKDQTLTLCEREWSESVTIQKNKYAMSLKSTGTGEKHDGTVLIKEYYTGSVTKNDTLIIPIKSDEIVTLATLNR